ncbi:hypothetical protein ABE527_10155 [Brucella sp. TWI432]
MTTPTTEQSAESTRTYIDPVAMANEARALNDFLMTQSLQNANNVVLLLRRIKELEAAAEEQTNVHGSEMQRITQERDQMMQMYDSSCQKIKEIQDNTLDIQRQLSDALDDNAKLKQGMRTARKAKVNG